MIETYVSDPMAGDLCLRPLWIETYVSQTYGWRSIYQTPMAGDLCLSHLWLEIYFSDPYGWRPMSQAPMRLKQSCTYRSVN